MQAFSFAFQPIVDVIRHEVFSYEALMRGPANEPAQRVFGEVDPKDLYRFDQSGRDVAVALAAKLGVDCHLNLNFLPRSLHTSNSFIRSTLETAARCDFPLDRIILEVTESEMIDDHVLFARLVNEYRDLGMKIAIDDFGAGYAGLNLLADFQPDMIKLDRHLVRGIERHGPRQSIVRAVVQVCRDLQIEVVVEGVETAGEYDWFDGQGLRLFQGFLFARPGFECLPSVAYPVRA